MNNIPRHLLVEVLINSRFGVFVLSDTVDEGHDEVGEEVEGHEPDEEPVSLGAGQLGLLQVNSKEDADDPKDLGSVTYTTNKY